jgi:hypothetical protein
MKSPHFRNLLFIFLLIWIVQSQAQQDVTIVAPTSEAAEGLDLNAVAELFKDSPNLEEFEKGLNDPDTGINNLDLDENGEVDFIRVVEEVSGETHVIILQALLGENEIQDVATIEIEKSGEDYNMQISGDELIYGPHYYIVPRPVRIFSWGIVGWMYRPVYRPYRSVYRFGYYPKWRRPFRPVTHTVYRTRTVKYGNRKGFTVTKTRKVKVTKVNHKRRSSTVVRTRTVKRDRGKTTVTRTKTVKRKKR